jgi:hypothetical protein
VRFGVRSERVLNTRPLFGIAGAFVEMSEHAAQQQMLIQQLQAQRAPFLLQSMQVRDTLSLALCLLSSPARVGSRSNIAVGKRFFFFFFFFFS